VRYDLLIFDLDGTLIDSVGDIADSLNEVLARHGLPTHDDAAVARMVGSGVRELVRRALPANHPLDEIVGEYRAHYSARPIGRTVLYPGVKETLAALPMRKAVATNKPGALARRILDELGVVRQFVAVLGEDDVGRTKPDPLIVERLRGETPRERTLYVGDSPVDAATARNAGVPLALVTYGYAESIRDQPAEYHLDRFADLQRATLYPSK
jgi:phosphoglycolate phosphatase